MLNSNVIMILCYSI